jgi:hypothetical protein
MPQRFREPQVSDPGNETLIEERLADEAGLLDPTKTYDQLADVRLVGEEIRPEAASRSRVERQHRAVPLRRHPLTPREHQPRTAPPWHIVGARLDPPAAAHAEMASNDDASLEAE